ncbi:MAG: S41 family peptidase [Bacteroidota bacterium]
MNYGINHYSDENQLLNKEYTSDLVSGKLLVNTPLYLLIDTKTRSAAAFFFYTLQSFEKAGIMSQSGAGGAHRNSFYTLNENFSISISIAAPINPKMNTNWENEGVIPDSMETNDPITALIN